MDKLSLYFITWNVATRSPGESVRSLLDLGRFPGAELPDFYFIGLQEVKAQPQNILLDSLFEDDWTKEFKDALAPHDYVKVKTVRLVGIMLNVFCLRKHLTHLRKMENQITRTGFKGLWGNKGATSLRFQIYGVNLCIVNSHFAPHDHQLKQRIGDYNTVIREQTFAQDEQTSRILYHDYIFWIGDLNFRLNNPEGTLSQDDILQKIKDNQLEDLLKEDQLRQVMRSGEAFSELNETDPKFQPTFKYHFNSHNYDPKRRCAWTDRILFKVNENNYEDTKLTLEQLSYTSLQDYGTSDHKPVLSEFKIKICPTIFADGCLPQVESDRSKRNTAYVMTAHVAFNPIESWTLDENNNVLVTFGGGFQPDPWDWIGVYHENFTSLDSWLCYVYVPVPNRNIAFSLDEEGLDVAQNVLGSSQSTSSVNGINTLSAQTQSFLQQRKTQFINKIQSEISNLSLDNDLTRNSTNNENLTTFDDDSTNFNDKLRNVNDVNRSSTNMIDDTRNVNQSDNQIIDHINIVFPDCAIRYPGKYRLIYFTKSSSDVLGISNVFQAVDSKPSISKHYNMDW